MLKPLLFILEIQFYKDIIIVKKRLTTLSRRRLLEVLLFETRLVLWRFSKVEIKYNFLSQF